MRALVILLLLPATALAQPAAPPKPLDAWVTDANGPVAGAEVRVVEHTKAPCPCKLRNDRTFDNSMPKCACPPALAWYRQRLASCRWPQPALAVMRSDAQGHFSLARPTLGASLEATTKRGAQWMVVPSDADRLAIELAAPITRRLLLDVGVSIRAALLYDDGHCRPFARVGATNTWSTVAPVPEDRTGQNWPVLIVEADGFATVLRTWFESEPELKLALPPATPVRGACTGNRVELENPFQRFVETGTRAQSFAFTGVLASKSEVRCLRDGNVLEQWSYSHADGLQESSPLEDLEQRCTKIRVVDRAGQPVAGAEVSFNLSHGSDSWSGTADTTDSKGLACLEEVVAGGELVAHPPVDRGGWCAGAARVRVTRQSLRKPLRVVLDVRPLGRSRWRGRVISPERLPVVGAYVTVRKLEPAANPGCSLETITVVTGPDGRFELPLQPRGTLTLEISHDWYASRELRLKLPSGAQEIQLDRGLTWSGRVLDPDGRVLDRCEVSLTLADHRLVTGTCSGHGFSLRTLVPGKAKLSIKVERHELGTVRTLAQAVELKPGKSLVKDVQWPRGEAIAGRVLDSSGAPIAGARLTALPKGEFAEVSRFSDNEVMLEADDQGNFTFRHLAPGTWTIRGDRRARQQTSQDISTGTTNVRFVTSR